MSNQTHRPFTSSLSHESDVPHDPAMRQHGYARLCAMVLIALGVTVLCGWFLHIEALKSVVRGYVTMKANTSIGLLLAGAALYMSLLPRAQAKLVSRIAAASVFFVGFASLCEYWFSIDLHIDQLIFRDLGPSTEPGRPSYVTSLAFCTAAVSLFFIRGGRISHRMSQVFALLLAAIALTSVVGYLYGVPVLYGSFANANSMAFHTGAGFLVLSCGLVLGQSKSHIGRLLSASERGSWLTRRALAVVVVLPVLLGYLYLRPAMNLGQLRFGMALFAVTLVLGGTLSLLLVGHSLNRAERQQREMMQVAMEAATAIELSEHELRLVIDNLPSLISYIDASERFVRVNRTYEEWLGLPADQIIGRTVRELLGDEYWERTIATREAARRGISTSIETTYPTVNGDRRAIVTYAPDLDINGNVRGFAGMVIDVEDQRRAEAALRQSEKLAAVGRLSSSIAHEINNPVDAAMNLVYIAREQIEDEEIKALLETADGELKRVTHIVNETLRFHKQSDDAEMVLAADVFQSVLTLHSRRLNDNRIEVLRRDRATQPFECFEGEIRQVLNNLIANALDAMPPGGRLTLRSRPATDWSTGRAGVAMTIADNGIGMDAKTRARVFEAFFTTKGIGGTGLGLWISSEIITRHGGALRIRTSQHEDTHGTVFVILLPMVSSPVQPDVQASGTQI